MDKYYKIGYVGDGYLDKVTPEDLEILTHINIAFGLVEDGKVKISHLKNAAQIMCLREINPQIKILLSVGGWGAGGFSNAAATVEGCEIFAQSALDAYNNLKLDGIDIDWEYPCSSSAGIDSSPEDKYTFTTMMQKIREALPDSAMVTIAAGASKFFVENTEMEKVAEYLDYVQLMTYDMAGGKRTGHHTNLYASPNAIRRSSADNAVDIFYQAGVPLDKIIIGAAFYSRDWKDVKSIENNGLYQETGNTESYPGFGPNYAKLYAEYINQNNYIRYWDDDTKSPYLFNGSHFITYDDEESIAHKCEYIKRKNIKGIMYWEHSCDETRRLLNAIKDNL